jgi:cytoskeletal protein CcmA (bactofilin family)
MIAASRNAMPSSPAQPSPLGASEASRPAASALNRPAAKRVLTVGPDIQMKGEITSCDRVVIEGMVDATMRDVHTVELAETGALKGTAEVEDAEISGSFEGDLVVRGKLTVYASGRIRGNVTYGEIEINRGGQISGNIRNAADAKSNASPMKKAA